MHLSLLAILASAAAGVSAVNITVRVGQGGLTFTPSSITAAVGDNIDFEFHPKNHTVTQSTFANPCTPLTGGIDSGFQPVDAAATDFPIWSVTVKNATAPLWFFCAQANHCRSGMVFAINPTADKTFEAFQAAAEAGTSPSSALPPPTSPTGSYGYGTSTTITKPSLTPTVTRTSTPAATSSSSNGAARIGGNAIGALLAGAGLVAGLAL